ncbi:glycerate kinase [Candidatus Enterococcus ikei]|uniref:glycerate kinase n=1 Tax=Candidatus Enterococcus ikei TaxID=2815326 RepID=UPI003241E479
MVTGEGKMDNQSIQGKVPVDIGQIAKKYNIPVIAFVGSFSGEEHLFYNEGISVEEAMDHADENLIRVSKSTIHFSPY